MLERRCLECGFDASRVSVDAVPGLIRENAARWPEVLARPDVRTRPRENRWSPLEYGCHVRDVFRLYDVRLHLMLGLEDLHLDVPSSPHDGHACEEILLADAAFVEGERTEPACRTRHPLDPGDTLREGP